MITSTCPTFLTLYQTPILDKLKGLQTEISKCDSEDGNLYKTLWEKEKMRVTSIFSFSNNIYKLRLLQDR